MTAAFHLNNQNAKRELDVYNFVQSYLFCAKTGQIAHVLSLPSGIVQKTILARHNVEATCGLSMGYWCQNTRTSALSLVYLTTEYCTLPVCCHSTYTCLIDSVLNEAFRIVTGCLRPTPTDHLSILSGILPANLC